MPSKKKTKTDSPFVSHNKLLEAIEVIKKVSDLRNNKNSGKKQLIDDQNEELVKLQISFKKTPYNKTTYIHMISIPHHWRHGSDFETCLIVKDMSKTPLTDRQLDLDETKSHYKEVLSAANCDHLVTDVLPMRELRNEYKLFEAKQKLCKSYDLFLCDRKLLHNKFDYLSRFLGKTFWIDDKKVPIPVDLTSSSLKSDLENKLNQTYLYLSGKGDSTVVNIGSLKQSTENLANNLFAVNKKLSELFGNNIRSLGLKTNKSILITFFLDCGFIDEIHLEKPIRDNQPIEDDFSHFIKSNVQVFKSGNIKVVPKTDGEIDSSDEMADMESKWLSRSQKSVNRKRSKKLKLNTNRPPMKRRKTKNTAKAVKADEEEDE